jgi:hypothetical protein
MTSPYLEERNGGYYIAGSRISFDSVVYAFDRGEEPEQIQRNFPFLKRRDRLLPESARSGRPPA